MTTAQTGGNVSQSITITTEQLQQMIQTATDHALAAVLQAAGAQVADDPAPEPEPLPEPEPAEDPRIAAIRKITRPVTRRLRWITVSYRQDYSKMQVNLFHRDNRFTPPDFGRQLHASKIDLDDPGHLDQVRAACDLAADLDQKIGDLVDRLLAGPGVDLGRDQSADGAPFGLFAQAAGHNLAVSTDNVRVSANGGRHD